MPWDSIIPKDLRGSCLGYCQGLSPALAKPVTIEFFRSFVIPCGFDVRNVHSDDRRILKHCPMNTFSHKRPVQTPPDVESGHRRHRTFFISLHRKNVIQPKILKGSRRSSIYLVVAATSHSVPRCSPQFLLPCSQRLPVPNLPPPPTRLQDTSLEVWPDLWPSTKLRAKNFAAQEIVHW